MPRNPKPGKPLAPVEAALAKALPSSSSIAEAGRKIGRSKQAAFDAYEALKIKAPLRCEQLGISRDRVFQRFDRWADEATRTVIVNQFGDTKDIPATDLRIRANAYLKEIFDGSDPDKSNDSRPTLIVNLGFIAPERAATILQVQSRADVDRKPNVAAPVDKDLG